ncbi:MULTISPECIES: FAD-dependent monooxygenase [unclassified Micromonospora]|uniref:FAD-dependent monooxygenase n=1 Tax=unclassified Micromonospora TaxID=2617518 RepID=UPI003627419A
MRSLRVVVIGGGPGGLFLGRLLKLADPGTSVEVHERNGPTDAFGFGVVFSDRTMSSFHQADPETYQLMRHASVSWTDMEIRLPTDTLRFGGYGFTAISRRRLLQILQAQARQSGVELHFHSTLTLETLNGEGSARPDVIAVADGVNSVNRDSLAPRLGTRIETGKARYIWFGTTAMFDAVTFPFVRTAHGTFGAHAYPFDNGMSTFIVETDQPTWVAAGMDRSTAAGTTGTDEHSRSLLTDVFAAHLAGAPLIGNNSRWAAFRVVHNDRWWNDNAVLLGDAAHTAHFSVGSGTKLAMEDAIALARTLSTEATVADAFAGYQAIRQPPVARTQTWAARSMRWWETFGRRLHLPPNQFGAHFVTRTGAISYGGLVRRHRDRLDAAEIELRRRSTPHQAAGDGPGRQPEPLLAAPGTHALDLPVHLGPLRLRNRIAVSVSATGDQQAPTFTYGLSSASLVLLDCQRSSSAEWPGDPTAASAPPVDRFAGRPASAREITARDGALGMVVDQTTSIDDLVRMVVATGAGMVEMLLGAASAKDVPRLTTIADRLTPTPLCVGIHCPPDAAWSALGDELLENCRALHAAGIAAVHLHTVGALHEDWDRRLDWSDRIRTEAELPVLLDGPTGWTTGTHHDIDDDCGPRLHLAVLAGRVDIVVARPQLTPDRPHRPPAVSDKGLAAAGPHPAPVGPS